MPLHLIDFADVTHVRDRLSSETSGEDDWKSCSSRTVCSSTAELPYPLHHASVAYKRSEDHYSARFSLSFHKGADRSRIFHAFLEAYGERYLSTGLKNGVGYIRKEPEDPHAYMALTLPEDSSRYRLYLGHAGCPLLEFPSSEEVFSSSISDLEKAANVLVSGFFSGRALPDRFKDFTIDLHCL